MGDSSKEKLNLGRGDAAQRLHDLAEQLSHGTIRLGNQQFQVADQVRLEVKADKDELEIEVKWRPQSSTGAP